MDECKFIVPLASHRRRVLRGVFAAIGEIELIALKVFRAGYVSVVHHSDNVVIRGIRVLSSENLRHGDIQLNDIKRGEEADGGTGEIRGSQSKVILRIVIEQLALVQLQ